MKVLFLDVDGVLNRYATTDRAGEFPNLNAELVDRLLGYLKDHKDINVVLSSAWRYYGDGFKQRLRAAGVSWVSETPNIGQRGIEIAAWLEQNEVERFAVLDDLPDVHPVQAALVQTTGTVGLEDKHLQRLDVLLGYAK